MLRADISPSASQLLAFLQGLFTFYHEGYELANEFEPYKQQLQFNLQNVSVCLHLRLNSLFHPSSTWFYVFESQELPYQ